MGIGHEMTVNVSKIIHDFDRDIYWVKITFTSLDGLQQSQVLAGASLEYLHDYYHIISSDDLKESDKKDWTRRITEKWSALGDNLFNHKIHYDIYSNTHEGEINLTDFLIRLET